MREKIARAHDENMDDQEVKLLEESLVYGGDCGDCGGS